MKHRTGPFPPDEAWAMPLYRGRGSKRSEYEAKKIEFSRAVKTQRLRDLLRARDGDLCHWCKQIMIFEGNPNGAKYATIEHLVKREHGGHRIPSNTALACRKCNNTRHTPEQKAKK